MERTPTAGMESLAAVIGMDCAQALADRFPGRDILISCRWDATVSQFIGIIGRDKTARLIEAYKGTTLYFPTLSAALRRERNRVIIRNIALLEKGMPTRSAVSCECARTGLSMRHIWRILAKHQEFNP